MFERANLTYLKALLDFRKDNKNYDKFKKVKNCIFAFEILECFELVNLLTEELEQYRIL